MKLNTKHFGEIDVDENRIIDFNEGIPGFESLKKFTLMSDEKDSDGLFYWLQSVDDTDVAFVLLNMVKIMPDYNPLVEKDQLSELETTDEKNVNFYNIAVLPENINEMTVNLKAPVVINSEKKKGKQVVCMNDDYGVRHYMFK